jgi:hypothetical protein
MQKLIFSRLAGLFLFIGLALATGCSPFKGLQLFGHKPTPEQQLSAVLQAHPELLKPDTVKVMVPILVPQVSFQQTLKQPLDTVYARQDRAQLDSLLSQLQASLDTAQATAVRAKLQRLLLSRPVLRDTLRFDTCGVRGKVWLKGRNYQLFIVRAAIQDTAKGKVLRPRLAGAVVPAFSIFRPATWGFPWWLWLAIGAALGTWLGCWFCTKLMGRGNA